MLSYTPTKPTTPSNTLVLKPPAKSRVQDMEHVMCFDALPGYVTPPKRTNPLRGNKKPTKKPTKNPIKRKISF